MALLMIRHGETASNYERIVQTPETPLNERGLRQARLLAERLVESGPRPTRLIASPLTRARMTAEALARGTGLEIEEQPLLEERNFGGFRGRSYAEIGLDIMAEGVEPPDGESWRVFHRRVDRVWQWIAEEVLAEAARGHVAMVTHGLVCFSLAERHLDLGGAPTPMRWGNASLTVIEPESPHRASLLNCTRHLSGEAADRLAGGHA